MKVLDLFSGIGGFSLGLERAGMETVAFCEYDEKARQVLKKHWPNVPQYEDVRTLTKEKLDNDGITNISVLCGGFPCQDISVAGNQAGIHEGTRSGLWSECARLLGEIRPQYAIFENVTALLNGGGGDWFKRILWEISEVGYDAEWHCISASELGAHHHRDRIWIVAYPNRAQRERGSVSVRVSSRQPNIDRRSGNWRASKNVADSKHNGSLTTAVRGGFSKASDNDEKGSQESVEFTGSSQPHGSSDLQESDKLASKHVAYPISQRQPRQGQYEQSIFAEAFKNRQTVNAFAGGTPDIWKVEPDLGRVADGVPGRSHRLKQLGNAVVPQIPEIIGRAILNDCRR